MKTKRDKIYCCLLLIGAIAVSIGISASSAKIKSVLSDTEMSRMYGGTGDCEECKYGGQGCDPAHTTGNPEWPYCNGTVHTSCLQGSGACENNQFYGWCNDYNAQCSLTKTVYTSDGMTPDGQHCNVTKDEGVDCPGTRPFCWNP